MRDADSRLHVGQLEVVADSAVAVLVVVATRQGSELPVEPLAACVVFAGLAPAVAAPVAERLDDLLQQWIVGEDGPALAHRHVVGRVEADRGKIAQCPDFLTPPRRPDGIAGVLYQPQAVLVSDCPHTVQVERVSQRMRQDDGSRPRTHSGFDRVRIAVVRRDL